MQFFNHRNRNLERGQGLAEYTALIPFTILLAIALSIGLNRLIGSTDTLVETFEEGYGLPCEGEALRVANGGDHSIESTSSVYNESDNTTTVTFTVTSGPKPSISHWTIGLPPEVAANIISTSEAAGEWAEDPTTGVVGVKFDIGYEGGEGGGGGNDGGNPDAGNPGNGGGGNDGGNPDAGNPGNGGGGGNDDNPGKGNKPKTFAQSELDGTSETIARDVSITFTGYYTWGEVPVAIKAGQDVHITTITAPIAVHDPSLDEECN